MQPLTLHAHAHTHTHTHTHIHTQYKHMHTPNTHMYMHTHMEIHTHTILKEGLRVIATPPLNSYLLSCTLGYVAANHFHSNNYNFLYIKGVGFLA